MNKNSFFLMILLCACSVFGANKNYYVIDGWQEDNGVVKLWYTVLGLLDEYDKGLNAGFEISFHENGKHFTVDRGANWWHYYFASNAVGSAENNTVIRVPRYKRSTIRFKAACTLSPYRAHYLLSKYMHINPELQKRLDALKSDHFSNDVPVVGVYYQYPMMDGQSEWDAVSLCNRVKQEIQASDRCKVILFTSLDDFATHFMRNYGSECERFAYLKNNEAVTPAECGERELLMMLLLAQCDMVIAPGSYQSLGAKMLNPDMELIELNTIPYALT